MLAIVVAITAVALGPTIWFDYVHQVRVLEHFWGSGTPDQMLNVRGALTRMIGLDEHVRIDVVSDAVWLAAMVLVGVVLVRRRIDRAHDARPAYALVISVALLSNPHLFIHDAVIWTVPPRVIHGGDPGCRRRMAAVRAICTRVAVGICGGRRNGHQIRPPDVARSLYVGPHRGHRDHWVSLAFS